MLIILKYLILLQNNKMSINQFKQYENILHFSRIQIYQTQ